MIAPTVSLLALALLAASCSPAPRPEVISFDSLPDTVGWLRLDATAGYKATMLYDSKPRPGREDIGRYMVYVDDGGNIQLLQFDPIFGTNHIGCEGKNWDRLMDVLDDVSKARKALADRREP